VDAKSQANTNAPSDGSPWTSVGNINGAGGTYLGAGWVLTASHVGPGDANFGGIVYPWDGTWVRLTNSDGTSTDLTMFHLSSLPPMPRMQLATTAPAGLSTVDMIGFGHIAGSAQTNFGAYSGFYWSDGAYKSWGNNKVASGGTSVVNAGYGDVTAFHTVFDSSQQTSDEAQASGGDSGGGVFQKSGSTWQMVGMLDAIAQITTNRPPDTALYGDVTYCANIATYRAQIVSFIAATPLLLTISNSGANVLVCWPDSGVSNNLVTNPDLTTTNWTVSKPALTLTNGQFCAQLPARALIDADQARSVRATKPDSNRLHVTSIIGVTSTPSINLRLLRLLRLRPKAKTPD
jgi:hypothetical protein